MNPFISKQLPNTSDRTVLLLHVKLIDPTFRRLLCLLLNYKVTGGQCAEANSTAPSFIIIIIIISALRMLFYLWF